MNDEDVLRFLAADLRLRGSLTVSADFLLSSDVRRVRVMADSERGLVTGWYAGVREAGG